MASDASVIMATDIDDDELYQRQRELPSNAPSCFFTLLSNLENKSVFQSLVHYLASNRSYRCFDGLEPCESAREIGRRAESVLLDALRMATRTDQVDQQKEILPLLQRTNLIQRRLPFRWPNVYNGIWCLLVGLQVTPIASGITRTQFMDRYVHVDNALAQRLAGLEQGTEEWLFARKFRASGSTIMKMLGYNDYSNVPNVDDATNDFIIDKLWGYTLSNEFMEYGSVTEDIACDVYEWALFFVTGGRFRVDHRGFMVRPETGGWCGASPDGISFYTIPNPGFDPKTPPSEAFTATLNDSPEAENDPRCQWMERRLLLEIKCPAYWLTRSPTTYEERPKYNTNRFGAPIAYYGQIQYLSALESTDEDSRKHITTQHFCVHLPERTQLLQYRSNKLFQRGMMLAAKPIYYDKFVPLALKYMRGDLRFGMLEEMDTVRVHARLRDIELGPDAFLNDLFEDEDNETEQATKRRRTAASDPPAASARDTIWSDDDAFTRSAIESEIEAGQTMMDTPTEYDRFVWKVMFCNSSVLRFRDMYRSLPETRKGALLDITSMLPNYMFEMSSRGKLLNAAVYRAVQLEKEDALRSQLEHAVKCGQAAGTLVSLVPCDVSSNEVPFVPNSNPEAEASLMNAVNAVADA